MKKCDNCDNEATWEYSPTPGGYEAIWEYSPTPGGYACDLCVPRAGCCDVTVLGADEYGVVREISGIVELDLRYPGFVCAYHLDEQGRRYPCVEWREYPDGFDDDGNSLVFEFEDWLEGEIK